MSNAADKKISKLIFGFLENEIILRTMFDVFIDFYVNQFNAERNNRLQFLNNYCSVVGLLLLRYYTPDRILNPVRGNKQSLKYIIMTTQEFKKLTQSNKPVFIDFYADWCEPCKMLDTIIEEIKPKLNGKAQIEKIDLDTHPELQQEFSIMSVPTLMIFKNGELLWRMPGFMMGDELVEKVLEFV